MIVCKDQLKLVNNYNWRLQNKITYSTNEDLVPFHELAFNSKYIIHKDGNKLDNRPENIEKVKVLKTQSTWFGVTYVEDKAFVESQIKELIQSGEYPVSLF